MAFDYDKTAATALKLLTRFGQTVTFVRVTGGSINPITGAEIAGTDACVTTTGLLRKYPDKMIDGTRILSGDRELILSNEQEPLPSDKPTINGEDWSIESIDTLSPAGTVVIYTVQVRK